MDRATEIYGTNSKRILKKTYICKAIICLNFFAHDTFAFPLKLALH